MIRAYRKVPLTMLIGTSNAAYEATNATMSHPNGYANGVTSSNYGTAGTYGKVIQDAVPFNYDANGSYLYKLYKSVTDKSAVGAEIPFGSGDWLVDTDAGVVTFYSIGSVTGISSTTPPLIDFYRYVGEKGGTAAGDASLEVTTTANTYLQPQTFDGGSGTSGDNLHSIIIDDRNLATITGDCYSLQIGGNYDGSWRILINSAGTTATTFKIQARESSVWNTKTHMEAS
jgi:hypothetical protein